MRYSFRFPLRFIFLVIGLPVASTFPSITSTSLRGASTRPPSSFCWSSNQYTSLYRRQQQQQQLQESALTFLASSNTPSDENSNVVLHDVDDEDESHDQESSESPTPSASSTLPSLKSMSISSSTTTTTAQPKAADVKCPDCDLCDGSGRIAGGIGAVLAWIPIKAYRPCPNFVARGGTYQRAGQGLDEIAFGRDVSRLKK
jgi:hypothetical protein